MFHVSDKKGVEEDTDEEDVVTTPPAADHAYMALPPGGKGGFYVCGELDSTVNVVKGGKVVQSLSTLPKPTPGNSTAECILSPNGQFVYTFPIAGTTASRCSR